MDGGSRRGERGRGGPPRIMMRSPNLHGGDGGVPVPPQKKKVMGGGAQTARMEAPSHTHIHTHARTTPGTRAATDCSGTDEILMALFRKNNETRPSPGVARVRASARARERESGCCTAPTHPPTEMCHKTHTLARAEPVCVCVCFYLHRYVFSS